MRIIAAIVALLSLAGCASNNQPPPPSPFLELSVLEHALDAAKSESAITCRSDSECAKVWELAKAFVQDHGDLKIETSSDTMIATKTYPLFPFVGLSAARVSSGGSTSRISLLVACPYLKDADSLLWHNNYRICARRASTLYRAFPLYINANLQTNPRH